MDESGIWTMVIVISIAVLIITFLTSVTAWHKKFVEKPLEKMEDKTNKDLVDRNEANKDTTNKDTNVKNPEGV